MEIWLGGDGWVEMAGCRWLGVYMAGWRWLGVDSWVEMAGWRWLGVDMVGW